MESRMPAVAGSFYPAAALKLRNQISILFDEAIETTETDVAALIVPHAGYLFSGPVAASGFKKLNRKQRYKNVFIIGRSHRKNFNGVSVYLKGCYVTPSGEVEINEETVARLTESNKFIYYDREADQEEHSLEVQLPLLQYWLYNDFKIVPLIIGNDDPALSEKLADALRPWFNRDNLFVISTDFSHYPDYEIACKTDAETADAIIANDSDKLKSICARNHHSKNNTLLTGLCGAAAVQTLLHLTRNLSEISFEKIVYKNSGDVPQGDKNRVVGYWSIAVNRFGNDLEISSSEKAGLLSLARESLMSHFHGGEGALFLCAGIFKAPYGAFVTLKNGDELRGCIGRFDLHQPLHQTIADVSILAATRDSRFKPVTADEMDQIGIEISILTPLKKINSIDQIELGKHGIYIKKGSSSGTFLPQVALETKWSKEEFLGHCARDKAGIGWEGWKNAELYIYEAIVFSDRLS